MVVEALWAALVALRHAPLGASHSTHDAMQCNGQRNAAEEEGRTDGGVAEEGDDGGFVGNSHCPSGGPS